jgi:hypothetical protein
MSSEEIIRRLIKDMEALKAEQRRLASLNPLFYVGNHNSTPITLSVDQNNYDPGNYDHITINTNAAINISGISGGVVGRELLITTHGGSGSVAYLHNSSSSSILNRIFNIGGATVTKTARMTMVLRYYYNPVAASLGWIQIV